MRLQSLHFSAYSQLCYTLLFLVSLQTLKAQTVNTNLPGPQNIEYFGGTAYAPNGSADFSIWFKDTSKYKRLIFPGSNYALHYRLLTPTIPPPANNLYPLFIMLHGAGEQIGASDDIYASTNPDLFQLKWGGKLSVDSQVVHPSYVLFPHVGQNWGNADVNNGWIYSDPMLPETKATLELIQNLIDTKNIDPNRIYINGLSAGGYGVFEFLERRPDLFAAATTMPGMGNVNLASNVSNTPLWMFQGGVDPFPGPVLSKSMYDAIVAQGGNPIRTNNKDRDHFAWEDAYKQSKWLNWLYGKNKLDIIVKFGGVPKICTGITTATLGISQGFSQYQWQKSDGTNNFSPIPGATSNEYIASSVGTYRVQFYRSGAWVNSNPVTVTENNTFTSKPAVTTLYSYESPLIDPNPNNYGYVELTGPVGDVGNPINYQWYKNGLPVAAPDGTSNPIKILITGKGKYTLQTRLQANCPSLSSDTVYVVPNQMAMPPLAAPSNLVVTGTFIASVGLQWQDNSTKEDGFLIEASTDGNSFFYSGYAPRNVTVFTALNLSPITAYWFRVTAVNATGISAPSGLTSTTTHIDNIPPTAPIGLYASNLADKSLTLNWNAATDNVGVVSYDIYNNNQLLVNTAGLTYNVSGLTGKTNYTFYVVARDANSNVSPKSNLVNVTTAEFVNGTNYSFYSLPSNPAYTQMPNFSLLTPDVPVGNTPAFMDFFSLKGEGSSPVTPDRTIDNAANNYFAYKFEAYIDIQTAGDYTFYLNSDDGSILNIDGIDVVNFDGAHGVQSDPGKPGTISLSVGKHPIRVSYFELTGQNTLNVRWSGPTGAGIPLQIIPKAKLWRINTPGTSNSQPLADAGTDVIVTPPANTAILNGNGSDADGFIQSYAWRYIPGSGPVTPVLSSLTSQTTNVTGLTQTGTYQFELTVTDNANATATDLVSVIVKPSNPVPVVTITNGASVTIKIPVNSVALTGTITDADPFTYVWNFISGPATYTWSNTNTLNPTISGLIPGTYLLSLIATDNVGGKGGDTISIIVQSDVKVTSFNLLDLSAIPNPMAGILSDGFLIDGGQFEPSGFSVAAITSPVQLDKLEWYIDGIKQTGVSAVPPFIITNNISGDNTYWAERPLDLTTGTHIIKAIPYVGTTPGEPLQVSVNVIKGAFLWDGGGSNTNWSTTANWDRDQLPTSTDKVRLDNTLKSGNYQVTFDAAATPVQSIIVGNQSSSTSIILNVSKAAIADGADLDLTVNKGGTLALSTNLTIGGNVVVNQGTIDLGSGTLTVNGTTSGTGSVIHTGNTHNSCFKYNGPANDIIYAGFYENLVINGTGLKTLDGTILVTDTIGLGGGTLVSNGNLTIDFAQGGISPTGSGAITGIIHASRNVVKGYHFITSGLAGSSYADFANSVTMTVKNPTIYIENNPSSDVQQGWSGVNYQNLTELLSGNKYDGGPSDLTGYAVYFKTPTILNMTGTYNHSVLEYDANGMSYTNSGIPASDGWHLIGNPYPSYIDYTKCQIANLNTSITFYDQSQGKNVVYSPNNGPFLPDELGGATQFIAPMQAFWVQTTAQNASLKVPNSARSVKPAYTTAQKQNPNFKPFYRTAASDARSLKLSLSGVGSASYDETIIRFSSETKDEFEPEYDSYKMINDSNVSPSLYSVLNNEMYAINSLNGDFSRKTIPLSVEVPSSGTYVLSLKMQYGFDQSAAVVLYDKVLNTSQDLLQNPDYTFNIDRSEAHDRFSLNVISSVTDAQSGGNSQIYVNQNGHDATLVFENISGDQASVYVTNGIGQQLISAENVNISNGTYPLHFGKQEHGLYIIQVVTAQRKYTKKIIIR